jgi:AraC-like DNA-binding protein
VFYIPYTRKYSNTDRVWISVYVVSGIIDVLSYILILAYHTKIISIIYFHFTMAITVLRLYMELIYRIVDKKVTSEDIMAPNMDEKTVIQKTIADKEKANPCSGNNIYIRMEVYMIDNQAWRNPNLSLGMLTKELGTNRTTLAKVARENGVESITNYINQYRIHDFIYLLNKHPEMSIKEAFYICGYRSRTTALRNFRLVTNMTPSEYFGRKASEDE